MAQAVAANVRFETNSRFALGVFKGILLAPMEDLRGAYSLHDPVIDVPMMAGVEEDVRDIVRERESGIRGYFVPSFCGF